MLVTLVCLPIFLVFGIVFGQFSWMFAAWIACGSKKWTQKWQSFSRTSIKLSNDHNILVAHGADFVLYFECVKPCRTIGKNMLIQYYKLGHSLSIYAVLFLLTLFKTIILFPIWASICCKESYNEQLNQLFKENVDDGYDLENQTDIKKRKLDNNESYNTVTGTGAYD